MKLIYDEIRRAWVKATPEELVRQQWIHRMVHDLGYPKEWIVVEKAIGELPHLSGLSVPDRRLDILCYGNQPAGSPFPLLLIECKAELQAEGALNQVIGYNHHVKAHFVGAAGPDQMHLGYFDSLKNKYIFCSFLPSFKELLQWVNR
jgi:hypothetical protein